MCLAVKTSSCVIIELTLQEGTLIAGLEQIAGRYWKIGMLQGSPVYWQEPPCVADQVNCKQLFLLRNDKESSPTTGWIVARSIEFDRVDCKGNVVAWGSDAQW